MEFRLIPQHTEGALARRHFGMLRSSANERIPTETVRIAQAALPAGNRYVKLRQQFGATLSDQSFASLSPMRGQPAAVPWRLALVTILQLAEGLSDREAADAVRGRIDWKYPGFDYSILSRFRDRLIQGIAEMLLLQHNLDKSRKFGLIRGRGDMRTDATHVIASVRNMNQSELVGETLRAALNVVATVNPKWLAANVDGSWYLKCAKRFETNRSPLTKGHSRRRRGYRRGWHDAVGENLAEHGSAISPRSACCRNSSPMLDRAILDR